MILIDSSVWIDHLRSESPLLRTLLLDRRALAHPLVVGEIAMGSVRGRQDLLELLDDLPEAVEADHREVRLLVERERLFGLGVGYIDAHLLASARLTAGALLWSRDKRLHDAALRLGVAFQADRPH